MGHRVSSYAESTAVLPPDCDSPLVPPAVPRLLEALNEAFFAGHFPNHPVMPGVLIIEAMAQTSAVLVVETLGGDAAGKVVYFMSIENARFRKPVVPGDQLRIHVVRERNRANVWRFRGEAKVDGSLVAEATYTAMIANE